MCTAPSGYRARWNEKTPAAAVRSLLVVVMRQAVGAVLQERMLCCCVCGSTRHWRGSQLTIHGPGIMPNTCWQSKRDDFTTWTHVVTSAIAPVPEAVEPSLAEVHRSDGLPPLCEQSIGQQHQMYIHDVALDTLLGSWLVSCS